MALFPTDAKDGQLLEADNGVYYVYDEYKNVWKSNNVVPKWADQVFIRGVENQTQQNVNDVNKAVNNKVGSIAAGTNQLVEVAFDVKTRGIWKHQSGPVAPDDPPVGLQCFLIEDAEGGKTQEYDEAAVLVLHAMGGGEKDKIAIGATEIGDLITIQNQNDLQGGSYIVTGIEEFNSDNPDELTDAYARYTVTVNEKATTGGFSADEMVTIRIFPRATEGAGVEDFDDRYLQLTGGEITGRLDVTGPVFVSDTSSVFKRTASTSASNYILSAEAPLLDPDGGKDVAFRVTADGSVKAGHDTSSPFMAAAKNDVVTKAYTDAHTLQPDKANDVTTSFRVKADGSTLISASGNELGLYHLKDPTDGNPEWAATKGYVDEQIAAIEIPDSELSTKEKLYLQGFYPFKFGESTQINNPGEFLVKDSSYLVTEDPEKWKYFYFSTTDAYGQDLAGQFLNHMHMDAQHEGQIWICKERGYKLCGYIGKMRVRDQNFEQYFNLEMDNSVQLLNPPNYDTQALRVDKGEVLWIKCSFWG
jgi:hypothetical protein